MATYNCELFIHVRYSAELSYDELYEVEAKLTEELQQALEEHDAEHIDVVTQGDALRVQCVFAEYAEAAFRELCDSTAGCIKDSLSARFLFVDKDLESAHVYYFEDAAWEEVPLNLADL